jgi:5'-nucleotidase (lipoprotein e(P4) family)
MSPCRRPPESPPRSPSRRRSPLALLLLLSACGGTAATPPAATPRPVGTLSPALHWFRNSAEYRAITLEVYRLAASRLEPAVSGLATGTWGVIMDADETILDNSEYQRRLDGSGGRFSETTWAAWVRERAATLVPGALEFTQRVHQLGGRLAVVTNRADSLCVPTQENLAAVGVQADLVLCQPPGQSDKNPRFERVQDGTAAPGLPPLTIVEWLGDNIQDFPGLTQAVRDDPAALSPFGVRFFTLPNPIYGSWQRNPER